MLSLFFFPFFFSSSLKKKKSLYPIFYFVSACPYSRIVKPDVLGFPGCGRYGKASAFQLQPPRLPPTLIHIHLFAHCTFPPSLALPQSGMIFTIIRGWSSESSLDACSFRKPSLTPFLSQNSMFSPLCSLAPVCIYPST